METEDVLALLQEVAAEVVDPRFRSLRRGEVTSKRRPGDLVTVADREAEVLITAALRGSHPDAVVLGEEAVAADPSLLRGWAHAPHVFTVDPVDGTRNFVQGSPDHAVMVAELRDGVVVRSWIWQPQHRTAYVAERGAGAWRDGVRLDTTRTAHPSRSRTGSCCGVDYPRLATGEAGWGVWFKTKPWDHAPGSLLLTEAGGRVGGPGRSPYRPATPPRVLVATSRGRREGEVGATTV
ncbi:inositol monophosphatase family protein [Nocardioides rubriscoriae]|uniref:inositol monophosphatase family protein n=1 Tax=Nocardioides rubriscoriae TaxID=642762 RepID=UPI0011E0534A|nr:inositol monophosphatase [Nocardioides rubriscoriae]